MAININDYRYDLPQERIALYPMANRDESKLLVYQKGTVSHRHFQNLVDFLPHNAFLFFNDTKVIPARLHFKKDTGADVEIFLLTPITPSSVLSITMNATTASTWKCTIGNLKRWGPGTKLHKQINDITLEALLINKEDGVVEFRWTGKKSFAEVISLSGETPLPPYLKREAEKEDRERYQTIYSHYEGAVAAPTAGLHFSENVFKALQEKGIHHDFVTLHVSAGTFQPVKTDDAEEHIMHPEQIIVTKKNLENLLTPDQFVIPIGTTSMRTLESLYWFGVKILNNKGTEFKIFQEEPYQNFENIPSSNDAIRAVLKLMNETKSEIITGETSIFIKPGYDFKICHGLITNFHQPGSTLMLLVAAFVGKNWKTIYHEAMVNNYRFLSFGDSSFLIP